MRNGILESNLDSDNGRPKIGQKVFFKSRVKYVLTELHVGPSGGHLGANRTIHKVLQRCTGSRQEVVLEGSVDSTTSVPQAAVVG